MLDTRGAPSPRPQDVHTWPEAVSKRENRLQVQFSRSDRGDHFRNCGRRIWNGPNQHETVNAAARLKFSFAQIAVTHRRLGERRISTRSGSSGDA